jgi:putative membrane protein
MKTYGQLVIAMLTVLALLAIGYAQQSKSEQSMPTGNAFINKAAEINLGEIELGKLARQRGNNDAVKQFGKLMVSDHTAAQNELRQLASERKITLPTQPGTETSNLDAELSRKTGAQFDQDYASHMLQGHKGAIAAFENEIEHGKDPAIKAYAEKVLPSIQDHIRIAEDLAGKMGMPGKAGLSEPDKAISAATVPK